MPPGLSSTSDPNLLVRTVHDLSKQVASLQEQLARGGPSKTGPWQRDGRTYAQTLNEIPPRPSRSENPDFGAISHGVYKHVQVAHHTENWKGVPKTVGIAVGNVVKSIRPPNSDVRLDCELKKAGAQFEEHICTAVRGHLKRVQAENTTFLQSLNPNDAEWAAEKTARNLTRILGKRLNVEQRDIWIAEALSLLGTRPGGPTENQPQPSTSRGTDHPGPLIEGPSTSGGTGLPGPSNRPPTVHGGTATLGSPNREAPSANTAATTRPFKHLGQGKKSSNNAQGEGTTGTTPIDRSPQGKDAQGGEAPTNSETPTAQETNQTEIVPTTDTVQEGPEGCGNRGTAQQGSNPPAENHTPAPPLTNTAQDDSSGVPGTPETDRPPKPVTRTYAGRVTVHNKSDPDPISIETRSDCKVLIVGDSNLRKMPRFPASFQIECYPGGNFQTMIDALKTVDNTKNIQHIVVMAGINERNNDLINVSLPRIQTLVYDCCTRFRSLNFVEIHCSPLLNDTERDRIETFNAEFEDDAKDVDCVHYIRLPHIIGNVCERDGVHLTQAAIADVSRMLYEHFLQKL